MTTIPRKQQLLDGLAIGASTLCLVHCFLLPALLVLVPTLAAFVSVPEEFHLAALAFAVPTSLIALGLGHRRHRRLQPTAIVAPGIGLLALGVLAPAESLETMLTAIGALLLATGHLLNWRALRH